MEMAMNTANTPPSAAQMPMTETAPPPAAPMMDTPPPPAAMPAMPQAAMEVPPVQQPGADQQPGVGAEGEGETPWYGSVKVMALLAAGALGLVGGLTMLRKRNE
jgi:hypothetical protein